jgi:DNA-binding transcriptional LysR family regulator
MAVDLSNIPDLGSRQIARRASNCLAMVRLGREIFHAVMPRQHRLAPSRGVTMKQIAREPLVSLPNDSRTRWTIDAAASKQGITLQHAAPNRRAPAFPAGDRLDQLGADLQSQVDRGFACPRGENLALKQ